MVQKGHEDGALGTKKNSKNSREYFLSDSVQKSSVPSSTCTRQRRHNAGMRAWRTCACWCAIRGPPSVHPQLLAARRRQRRTSSRESPIVAKPSACRHVAIPAAPIAFLAAPVAAPVVAPFAALIAAILVVFLVAPVVIPAAPVAALIALAAPVAAPFAALIAAIHVAFLATPVEIPAAPVAAPIAFLAAPVAAPFAALITAILVAFLAAPVEIPAAPVAAQHASVQAHGTRGAEFGASGGQGSDRREHPAARVARAAVEADQPSRERVAAQDRFKQRAA